MEAKKRQEAKRNLDYSYFWASNPSLWGVYDHRELFPEDFQPYQPTPWSEDYLFQRGQDVREERVDSEVHQVEDGQDEEAGEQPLPGGQFARERINVLKACLTRIKAKKELGPEPFDGPDVTTIRCNVDNFFSRKSDSRIINAY